ncbi:MBL fold metallo-hydrolase [Immundisolibacter sp.]|uniref:MBL fold metallo-hydrolase n=1 Tax=Immundisolibacter sp. TaxID=1934948 RepID=UPI003565F4FC
MHLTFLGAAGSVTGSKYLLEVAGRRLLVDCGLFQGYKQLRLKNWAALPVKPASLDAVLLTHAHIDHSGYLPLLVKNGYGGRVWCTPGTAALCEILLPDSGHLQQQDAEYANRKGFSRHRPALPLYDKQDAIDCLPALERVEFNDWFEPCAGVRARLRPAGHILGASSVELEADGRRLLFSGDLGRNDHPILYDPAPPPPVDYLVVESTYGDRLHPPSDPAQELAAVIKRTAARGGMVLIPAFAVGRTQELLFYIHQLKQQGAIPDVPVFLDSPMAINASELLQRFASEHRLSAAQAGEVCATATYVREREDSIALNSRTHPMIIISASGMITGGRVLHHLKARAGNPDNTILFAGYQAGGTRGAALLAGAQEIKLHGRYLRVKAEVASIENLSAHADWQGILDWLSAMPSPRQAFVTHGEPAAADALRLRLHEKFGWAATAPTLGERVHLK